MWILGLKGLNVPKTKCKTFGDRAFDGAGASLWNTQTFFILLGICSMNQFLYGDCGDLFSSSLARFTVCYVFLFVSVC